MIRHIPEATKNAIDVGSPVSVGVSAAVAAITMNQIVLALTAVSVLLNIAWMVLKMLYLRKHGGDAFWGARND